jgi:hypothetical protein
MIFFLNKLSTLKKSTWYDNGKRTKGTWLSSFHVEVLLSIRGILYCVFFVPTSTACSATSVPVSGNTGVTVSFHGPVADFSIKGIY